MFYHAFNGYMNHAFPSDELRPLSCEGEDTLGGYALTLVTLNLLFFNLLWYILSFCLEGFVAIMPCHRLTP